MSLSPLTAFALLAQVPDEALDLEALATAMARLGRPELTGAEVRARLDALAAEVADDVDPGAAPDRLARQLRAAFGGRLDLRGDPSIYQHDDASFIDRVVETRRGLPILLSVVWILLGERLGVPIRGVNFPGHFLVCIAGDDARIYQDPYTGGALVEPAALLARLGPDRRERAVLEPCGVRPIVARMLVNLKHLYVDRSEWERALAVVDRLLLVAGEDATEVRDRGLLCYRIGRRPDAARDLRRYLKLSPQAEDRGTVEGLLRQIESG